MEGSRLDGRWAPPQQLGHRLVDQWVPGRRASRVASDQIFVLLGQNMPVLTGATQNRTAGQREKKTAAAKDFGSHGTEVSPENTWLTLGLTR